MQGPWDEISTYKPVCCTQSQMLLKYRLCCPGRPHRCAQLEAGAHDAAESAGAESACGGRDHACPAGQPAGQRAESRPAASYWPVSPCSHSSFSIYSHQSRSQQNEKRLNQPHLSASCWRASLVSTCTCSRAYSKHAPVSCVPQLPSRQSVRYTEKHLTIIDHPVNTSPNSQTPLRQNAAASWGTVSTSDASLNSSTSSGLAHSTSELPCKQQASEQARQCASVWACKTLGLGAR